MKETFYSIFIILFFTFINIEYSFAQQTNLKIQEVYGDKMQELVQNNPEHIKLLTELLEIRIKIIESPTQGDEKYTKLSTVPLLNKNNKALTRDLVYDQENFNPLKYDLNFFPMKPAIYRIDNTDFLIVITPQSLNK